MARPEFDPETPLAERLREIRRALGDPDRGEFAEKLGLPKNTLANYERGKSKPDSDVLNSYLLIGINLHWLLTGTGEMFTDPAKAPPAARAVDSALMHKLAQLARDVHKEIGSKPHGDTIVTDAADLYNELIKLVQDLSDKEEIEATLPRLRLLFKRKLQEISGDQEEGRNIA